MTETPTTRKKMPVMMVQTFTLVKGLARMAMPITSFAAAARVGEAQEPERRRPEAERHRDEQQRHRAVEQKNKPHGDIHNAVQAAHAHYVPGRVPLLRETLRQLACAQT